MDKSSHKADINSAPYMHAMYKVVVVSTIIIRVAVRSSCTHYTNKPCAFTYLTHRTDSERRCGATVVLS